MDKDAMWEHTAAQRLRLADLLDGLTEEQWATPSLCQGWTVRHVAAHASMSGRWQAGWGIPTFVRAGFRVNRFTDLDARRLGFPFFARRRLRGTHLRATNADWEAGTGELVEEPIESLLLRLTGRRHPVR